MKKVLVPLADYLIYNKTFFFHVTTKKGRNKWNKWNKFFLTYLTRAPVDQKDHRVGSPVLGPQAADAGVGPAVAAAHRSQGDAHTGTADPAGAPRHPVAPQSIPAGQEHVAALPAYLPFCGPSPHAAAAGRPSPDCSSRRVVGRDTGSGRRSGGSWCVFFSPDFLGPQRSGGQRRLRTLS